MGENENLPFGKKIWRNETQDNNFIKVNQKEKVKHDKKLYKNAKFKIIFL